MENRCSNDIFPYYFSLLCAPLHVREQVCHPRLFEYRTCSNILLQYPVFPEQFRVGV